MNEEIQAMVVKFKDGTYFGGVKGKLVRYTDIFNAKRIHKKLNIRDALYLSSQVYSLIKIKFTAEEYDG